MFLALILKSFKWLVNIKLYSKSNVNSDLKL